MKEKRKKFNQSLGKLEAEIMEVMWKLKNGSVREVLGCLTKKRKIAYTTVMTVMVRLCDKGILKRKFDNSGAYIYAPTHGKQTFLASASRRVINLLIEEFGDIAVAQFIDIVESSDAENLKEWRQKLKGIK